MNSLRDVKLSPSKRSNGGETSAPKRLKSLTLFEDLLDNPDTDSLHLRANLEGHDEKQASTSGNQNEANTSNEQASWLSTDFSRISDDNVVYQNIKKPLGASLKSGGYDVKIEAIYKNGHSSTMGHAKFKSFGMYLTAIKEKCGGNANMISAWYGAPKDEISGILSYGFNLPLRSGIFGYGYYFSTGRHPLPSLQFSTVDEDGLRHMLLCWVILGKVEVMAPGSEQHSPSSEEFDSGIDSLTDPKKIIIWNSKVNTHVWPEYVVSFRTSSNCNGEQ